MPQFQINDNASPDNGYDALNTFAKGYVEALFFTNGDTGDDNEALTPEAVSRIAADCLAFEAEAKRIISQHIGFATLECAGADYTPDRAGHDFWLTRQGHGVGFWAREFTPGGKALGDALSEAAKACGEAYIDTDGERIHYT